MVRRRAEHNNCEISTLEEISLHQQDIEKCIIVIVLIQYLHSLIVYTHNDATFI